MEEDGNYNNNLGGITFNYCVLNEQLTPPVNMCNCKGPVLPHSVEPRFENFLNVCKYVAEGMINFLKDYSKFKSV